MAVKPGMENAEPLGLLDAGAMRPFPYKCLSADSIRNQTQNRASDGRLPCAYFLLLRCLDSSLFARLPALAERAHRSSRISADLAATSWKSVRALTVERA